MSVVLAGVSFRYPGTPFGVFDVDLAVGDGELLAVIGASGCGKTTLLKTIAGFVVPQSGKVFVDGREVTAVPVRARDLGIVFQAYALFPHMTAWQNVAYPLKVRGAAPEARRRLAHEALARVGLQGLEDRRPDVLSGGQQQRVALARALVFQPKALLLDEPLSALDAGLRSEMRDEIRRLQREFRISTLHVTHDQEEALSMADRVAVMEAGRLIQVATPGDLYDFPASRSIADFVGEANLWTGRVEGPDTVRVALGVLRTRPHGVAPGLEVTVLVRPERVGLGAADGGDNAFRGRVVRDRFLGSVRRYDFAVADATILGETGFRGDITGVHIPPEHVQLLLR